MKTEKKVFIGAGIIAVLLLLRYAFMHKKAPPPNAGTDMAGSGGGGIYPGGGITTTQPPYVAGGGGTGTGNGGGIITSGGGGTGTGGGGCNPLFDKNCPNGNEPEPIKTDGGGGYMDGDGVYHSPPIIGPNDSPGHLEADSFFKSGSIK